MDNSYVNAMKGYLEKHRPNFGEADIHSLIDFLFNKFEEENPLVDDAIRKGFRELGEMRKSLPDEMRDDYLYLVSDLCLAHARKSFREGILIGVRLLLELDDA